MIVFGLGSGRSGTSSLQALLNAQHNAVCFHEVNPSSMAWSGAEPTVVSLVNDFQQALNGGPRGISIDRARGNKHNLKEVLPRYLDGETPVLLGDVALYYLPYVEKILEIHPDARFPCICRDRTATIMSFVKKLSKKRGAGNSSLSQSLLGRKKYTRNHWINHNGRGWSEDPIWDKCFPKFTGCATLEDALAKYWDSYYAEAERLETKYPENFKIFDIDTLNNELGQSEILDFCGVSTNQVIGRYHENTT